MFKICRPSKNKNKTYKKQTNKQKIQEQCQPSERHWDTGMQTKQEEGVEEHC